jgi:hypothetical protein
MATYEGKYSRKHPTIKDKGRNSRADGRTTPPHNPRLVKLLEKNSGTSGPLSKGK